MEWGSFDLVDVLGRRAGTCSKGALECLGPGEVLCLLVYLGMFVMVCPGLFFACYRVCVLHATVPSLGR